jgi:hypothetical protein
VQALFFQAIAFENNRVGQDVQARIRTLCNLIPGEGSREWMGQFSGEWYHLIIGFSGAGFHKKLIFTKNTDFHQKVSFFQPFFLVFH